MAISSGLGIAGAVPIGVVNPFAGATAPSGWLLCFGQTVSRTQYSGLFLTIGTTYGAGDGSTTFALPDLRGRTIAGEDDMGGTAANRLTSGGSGITGTTVTLTRKMPIATLFLFMLRQTLLGLLEAMVTVVFLEKMLGPMVL
jgi:microcystin-dependent protein